MPLSDKDPLPVRKYSGKKPGIDATVRRKSCTPFDENDSNMANTRRKTAQEEAKKHARSVKKSASSTKSSKKKRKHEETSSEEESSDDELAQENKALKKELAELRAQKIGKTPKNSDASDGMRKLIRQIFRGNLWNSKGMKFVQDTNQLGVVVEALFDQLPGNTQKSWGSAEKWGAVYQDSLAKEINETRQFVQQRMHHACNEYMAENNGLLPEISEIEAILKREIPEDDEQAIHTFTWWWDKLLPSVTGNKFDWSPKIKYYATISKAKPNDPVDEDDLAMPPNTEAFGAVFLENYRETYMEQYQKKQEDPEADLTIRKDSENKNKYSRLHVGQNLFGAWKEEGLLRFNFLKEMNVEGRKKKESRDIESKILNILRRKNKIEGERPPGRKKKASKIEPPKKIINTFG